MDALEKWIAEHPQLLALLPTIALFFKRGREFVIKVATCLQRHIRDRVDFQKDVRAGMISASEDRASIREIVERVQAIALRSDKALFNGGRAGLVQQTQLLVARANIEFEAATNPAFQCDQDGNNIATNASYRRLVAATRNESLTGHQWVSATCGPLEAGYREHFAFCAQNAEDFVHEVDFMCPMTGAPRGRWRVVAPAVVVGEGLIYFGELFPVDALALEVRAEINKGLSS